MTLVSSESFAQSGGLAFLKIEPSAEALAIGSAQTAVTHDAFSTFVNPSGLGGSASNSAALTYNAWTADSRIYSFAGLFKVGSKGGLGVALSTSTSGAIDSRTQPGPASSSTSVTYLTAGVGYGHEIGRVRIGLTAKYVLEQLFEYHANGVAVDLGVQADVINDRVWIGAGVQNLGDMQALNVQQTELPETYRVGLTVQPFTVKMSDDDSEPIRLFASADIVYRSDEEKTFAQFGLWVNAFDFLWVRSGYLVDNELRDISFGLGIGHESFRFDYAYVAFSEGFGNAGQIVSLHYVY
jgi:hypothetical protein